MTSEEIERFKVVYSIAAIYSVLSFPFIPVNGILTAHEKIIQLKLADVFQKLFIVATMTVCLLLDYGLYALVLINALGDCYVSYSNYYASENTRLKRFHGVIFLNPKLKRLASYSGWVTVIALAQRCIFNLAPTILGITSGADAIAILGIAMTIEGYCYTFSSALNGIFLPKVTRIVIKEGGDVLPLMIKVGRIQLFIISFIVSGFICFGRGFINLWVGQSFEPSYLCAVLIIIPAIIHLPRTIGIETIYAQNRVKSLAIVFLIMAVLNVTGAFLLSPSFGAMGICISICFVYGVRTIGLDLILWKNIGLHIGRFFHSCFVNLLPTLLTISIIGYTIAYFMPPATWILLIVDLTLFSAAYFFILYRFGLNQYEKNLILSPVKRVFRIK